MRERRAADEDRLPGCGREGGAQSPDPRLRITVTFQDIDVTATKDRLWHVEAAGRSASAKFLDQAIDLVLPRLSYEEQDSLLVELLTATRDDT